MSVSGRNIPTTATGQNQPFDLLKKLMRLVLREVESRKFYGNYEMERYELHSPWRRRFEWFRKWVTIVSCLVVAFLFWGLLAAGLTRYFFKVSEEGALLYVGLPTGLVILAILWAKLPKLTRALGFDDHLK